MQAKLLFLPQLSYILLGLLSGGASREAPGSQSIADAFFEHTKGLRVNTDAVIYDALCAEHDSSQITIVSKANADLFAFADSGHAVVAETIAPYTWKSFVPGKGKDAGNGTLTESVKFGVFSYVWNETSFLLYFVDGRDGTASYPALAQQYIIGPPKQADDLIRAAASFTGKVIDQVWVFDQGFWQKDPFLWQAAHKASWDNVILETSMKRNIQNDVSRFFASRDEYHRLNVPWKRGLIFHGPPGNGKSVSIKAIMHELYELAPAIPTLYVKTLNSYGNFALKAIFEHARISAPCFLVFEDLDSLVTPDTRSYFLNQIDGLQPNDGILMVGSTNFLEYLDPGLANRPSRFDRKYFFPIPNFDQRLQYCNYWRSKLADNHDVDFPEELSSAIANITDRFSFAYIQEAFVGSLLEIVNEHIDSLSPHRGESEQPQERLVTSGEEAGLEKLRLWRVIRKQVALLRKELEHAAQDTTKQCAETTARAKARWTGHASEETYFAKEEMAR